ncbi:MAG: hypothetical protein QG597_855 [Actinomycetota bacterium]|nr:hypothetical protein [Actinomycetota bacterium]
MTATTPTRVCESCRNAPAAWTWSQPGAGAPFLLCTGCAPADAVPLLDAPSLLDASPVIQAASGGGER